MRMHGATDDVPLQVDSCVASRGISDITRTATRTRKEGSGLRDCGLYIPAVQAELSFSLVLVKSFIVFSTAGCALVAPGIVRYKAHGMSYLKRGVRANPSNPPGYILATVEKNASQLNWLHILFASTS